MSDLPDDKTFDEYLQRHSTVSQHYRNLDSHDVPAALDSAVLAQAREALVAAKARSRPAQKSLWTRWSAPIALAASLVLGVAVVLEIGVEDELALPAPQARQVQETVAVDAASVEAIEQVTEQPLADTAAAPFDAPKLDTPPSAPATPRRLSKASDAKAGAEKREALVAAKTVQERAAEASRRAAPVEPPPPESPSPATPFQAALEEQVVVSDASAGRAAGTLEADARRDQPVTANAVSRTRGQAVPGTSAMRQTAAAAPVDNASQDAQPPRLAPPLWLEQIRALRREGKVLEADEQWRRFAEAYPDFEVAGTDPARPRR